MKPQAGGGKVDSQKSRRKDSTKTNLLALRYMEVQHDRNWDDKSNEVQHERCCPMDQPIRARRVYANELIRHIMNSGGRAFHCDVQKRRQKDGKACSNCSPDSDPDPFSNAKESIEKDEERDFGEVYCEAADECFCYHKLWLY